VAGHAQQVVSSYAAATLRKLQPARALASPAVAATAAPGSSPLNARARVWFNPNLKSREYFVPGVIVNIIALVTIMLTAMSIVREKEIGTMEQLMVTPIRPIELMLGKILPFAIVGLFEVALVTAAALVVFRIPFRGSIWMLLGASVAFLLTTLGVGLFISTISHTQQQAMMASTTFFMPAMMLSGFAFPIRNMPPVIQYLTYLNPLRYFMEIARGVFLKGTGAPTLWPQMLALTLLGALVLAFSSLRFRKRLD
ncbi:MAG: ABC transporter permease, partial [Acidobacteriota bacterium]